MNSPKVSTAFRTLRRKRMTVPDVVLVYKRDTWDRRGGWSESTPMGTFTASGDVATVVLESGNLHGVDSGTLFDDLVVGVVSSRTPSNLSHCTRRRSPGGGRGAARSDIRCSRLERSRR